MSNDDAGIVSFRVNVPNRPTLGQDMVVDLFVDSDANPQTGDLDLGGTDYVIELIQGEANLFRWDGTNFTRRFGDPPAVTLSFSYQGGVTFRIAAAELGNTKRLNFFVLVESGIVFDPTTGEPDFHERDRRRGPRRGHRALPVHRRHRQADVARSLVFKATPAAPRAGAPFTLRVTVARWTPAPCSRTAA